jgi:hypothetical protein
MAIQVSSRTARTRLAAGLSTALLMAVPAAGLRVYV